MNGSSPRALKGVGLLTAVGLFGQGMGFCYRVVLSRLAGAEVMGLYQLVMPVYSLLLSLTAVGLTVAVSTLSARYHALGDRGAVNAVLRRGVILFLAAALPLGAGLILCSDALSVHLLGDARTRLGVILLVPCVLLTGLENLHKHCFYGQGCVRPPALSETVEQLVRTGAVLGLLFLLLPQNEERTVGLIITGMVICEVFSAAVLIALTRRRTLRLGRLRPVHRVTFRQLLTVSIPVSFTSLLGTLMNAANSVLIPRELVRGGMDAAQALSAFGVLCGMTMPMLALPTGFLNAIGLTMTPGLARQAAVGRWDQVRSTLDHAVGLVSLILAPAMALLTVVGPDLGQLLFGSEQVGDYMLPLAAGTLLAGWQTVFSGALNGMGRQRQAARTALLCDGVQLCFTLAAVARRGLAGFAAGFLLSALLGAIMDLATLRREIGLRPRWREWFLSPLLAALLTGLCSRLLFQILTASGLSRAAACAAVLPFGLLLDLAALQAQGIRLPGRPTPFKDHAAQR